jgi:hypothetical protein
MNNLESIRELEDKLLRLRVKITEDQAEYEKLDKKIKNIYVGIPLGLLGFACASIMTIKSLPADSTFIFSNTFWTILAIWLSISLVYPFFILFGTNAGKRRAKLYKDIELAKKKKKKKLEITLKRKIKTGT